MGDYQLYEETLPDVLDIDANVSKTKTIPIPRDKDIQKIWLRLSGTCTGTLSAWNEDNPMKIIPNIQLRGGKDVIFDASMATLWQLNAIDFSYVPERTALTLVGDTAFAATVVINFMKNARNPLDVSHVLPARNYPNLNLKVQIGAATDLCTGITLGSGCQLAVKLTQCDPNPLDVKFIDRDIIRLAQEDISIIGANTGYKEANIDAVGYKLRRIMVKAIDNSLRSDAFVTNIRVKDRKKNKILIEDSWAFIKNQDLTDYSLNPVEYYDGSANISYRDPIGTPPTPKGGMRGICVLDFDKARNSQFAMRNFLDLRTYNIGDMKLGYINSAGSGTRQITKVEEYVTKPSK